MGQALIKNADEALYCAKKQGKTLHFGEQTEWLPAESMEQSDAGDR